MTTYVVHVQREGNAWTAHVDGLPGAHTWGKGIRHLKESVRDTIILAAGLPEDAQFETDWDYATGDPDLDELAAHVRDRRDALSQAHAELLADTEELVGALLRQGFSTRDAATISGLSSARVGQLAIQRQLDPTRKRAPGLRSI